ncbi:MAG TPA: peptidoglycan DD-metalloendopeptidase family protein [Verrucomicrobiae bacterium]|nr:peptidoglycan DD-metalloendopeptidase family protein [Verrucomicrobiae bacterium]
MQIPQKLVSACQNVVRLAVLVMLMATLVGGLPFASLTTPRAYAASLDELNRRKAELERQARQAEHDALQQKSVAERAAARIQQAEGQISSLQSSINETASSIANAEQQIVAKDKEAVELEATLKMLTDRLNALLQQMYIQRVSRRDAIVLFTNQPASDREREQAQLDSVHKAAAMLAAKTKETQIAVAAARSELARHKEELIGYQNQQAEQVRGLAVVQDQQAQLKENAESAEEALEAKARQARAEQNKVEQQISAELAAIIAARARAAAAAKKSGTAATLGAQSAGLRVKRGTLVGHEGSTGNSTGPHVHFEARRNNVAVNPLPYVQNGTLSWPLKSFVITQYFGETANSTMYGGASHMGMDIAAAYGAPVYAPADGTVILNKYYGGYGYAWAEELDSGLVVLLGHMTGK